MELGLKGKTAIVTGGASGIGRAVALALASEGADVAIFDINATGAEQVAGEIAGDAGRAIAVACDVTSRDGVSAGVNEVVKVFGAVHIVVNNVGIAFADWLEDITDADMSKCFALNCGSHLVLTQAVAPFMKREHWGRIIYIASGSGQKPSAGMALYSASKFFLRGLAGAVGLELGAYNITANVVCPSDVFPESDAPTGAWTNPKLIGISCEKEGVRDFGELVAARKRKNPMKRACRAEYIADLVTFLASDRAGFINAQTIGVNGGIIPT